MLTCRWTINTKYYTADVSMWMAHLFNEFSITGTPMLNQVAALVMVFDLNNVTSLNSIHTIMSAFSELKKWVSRNDIQNFDILLCIGNKADLVPGHSAHIEYRRHLLNLDESSECGISETEGSSLLGDEESSRMLCGLVRNGAWSIT
ncbi:putative alpha/gamma-adaptin-binding protein p34 [Helianthus anomalus]